MKNRAQVEYWNQVAGSRWVSAQESMDGSLRPLGLAAMDRLGLEPGRTVLDVGCGCGDTVISLVERGARVVGVDVSGPMLARAAERVAGLPGVELRHADAAAIELPAVDAIYSRFGVMFFDDPVEAFAHLRGALRPGGRLAFVCWRSVAENPWAKIPMEAVMSVTGPPPPADPLAPGPFAFADGARVARILTEAGYSDVAVTPLDRDLQWTDSDDEAALREKFLTVGPGARLLAGQPPEVQARAGEAMLSAVRPYLRRDGLFLGCGVWLAEARR